MEWDADGLFQDRLVQRSTAMLPCHARYLTLTCACSEIDALLESDDVKLADILQQDDLIQEVRSFNEPLLALYVGSRVGCRLRLTSTLAACAPLPLCMSWWP